MGLYGPRRTPRNRAPRLITQRSTLPAAPHSRRANEAVGHMRQASPDTRPGKPLPTQLSNYHKLRNSEHNDDDRSPGNRDVRCRPLGSPAACEGCHGRQEAVERSQRAHPRTAHHRGRCRRHPQGCDAQRHQASASKSDPRPEVAVGRGGGSRQLRRGRADLVLRVRAAAASIAAQLTPSLVVEGWSAERRATDGIELLRSALGPCRNGRVRASAVTIGHRRCRGTARRGPSGSGSWDDAGGRCRLWSEGQRSAPSGSRRAATGVRDDRRVCSETVEDHDRRFWYRWPLTWRSSHAFTVLNTTQFHVRRLGADLARREARVQSPHPLPSRALLTSPVGYIPPWRVWACQPRTVAVRVPSLPRGSMSHGR
jgi:hypothetical protein